MYEQAAKEKHRGELHRAILMAVFALLLFFTLLGSVMLEVPHIFMASFELGGGMILLFWRS